MKTSPNDRFDFNEHYLCVESLRTWSRHQVLNWWMAALGLFREAGLSSTPSKFLFTTVNIYVSGVSGMTEEDRGLLLNFLRQNNVEQLEKLREDLHGLIWRALWRPVPSAPPPAPPAPPPSAPVFGSNGKKLRGKAAVLAPDREEARRAASALYGAPW